MTVEQYLINKYGINICKYSGFEIMCYIIKKYKGFNNVKLTELFKEIGNLFGKKYGSIERNLRHFRIKIGDECATNKDFVLTNIIGYRNEVK